jgi:hypothetical protein
MIVARDRERGQLSAKLFALGSVAGMERQRGERRTEDFSGPFSGGVSRNLRRRDGGGLIKSEQARPARTTRK